MDNESNAGSTGSMESIETNKENKSVSNKNGKSSKGFIRKYPILFTALLGLLAVVIVYFWKDLQGRQQKKAIEKMAEEQLMDSNKDYLKAIIKPFIWSIRSEMLRDNMEQVSIYANELVKEKNFQFIHLINPDGEIIISTDKKMEGKSAKEIYEPSILETDSVFVFEQYGNILTAAAPVMGYDKKLAVLIMNYEPVLFMNGPENKIDTVIKIR